MGKKGLLKFWGNMLGKEPSNPKQAPSTTQRKEMPKVNPKPPSLFDGEEERAAVYEKVRKQLAEEAARENETYDPDNDPEVSKLLQMLSEVERSEFFKVRERSTKSCADDEVLSQRELDILNLKAMVKSAEHRSANLHNVDSIRWDNMPEFNEDKMREFSPAEILLLSKIDGKIVGKFAPPGYFIQDYHLNLNDSIRDMFASGLLCYADLETCLNILTVKELKPILQDYNLPVSGKKSVLIEKLLQNCDSVELERRTDRCVALTSRGKEIAEKYDVLPYCQNNSVFCTITLDEAALLREEHPEWSKYQIVRSVLEDQGKKHLAKKDYGLYRNTLFGISETYRHESNEDLQKHYLLQCCYLDAIGYANGNAIEDRLAILAPGLVAQLRHIYKDDIKPFGEDYQNAVKSLPVPRSMDYEIRAFGMIRQALLEQDTH